jgi:methionine biosynthesis protein MetW
MEFLKQLDNRLYNYAKRDWYIRDEFPIINDWIVEGSKVIDLGCGNGSLMKYILDRKSVDIQGIESSLSGVQHCLQNGLRCNKNSIDIAETYQEFGEKEFDYAICNVTLQMVLYPEVVLKEMKRIASFCIISFPNFAYISNRLDLLWRGRMPRAMLHGYEWFSTGNIHQLSIVDFKNFCRQIDLRMVEVKYLGSMRRLASVFFSNLFSKEAIFLCR